MSYLDIRIPHTLNQRDAMWRVQAELYRLRNKFQSDIKNLSEEWTLAGGSLHFYVRGLAIHCQIHIGSHFVKISSRLPYLLAWHKDNIRQTVEARARQLLGQERQPGE